MSLAVSILSVCLPPWPMVLPIYWFVTSKLAASAPTRSRRPRGRRGPGQARRQGRRFPRQACPKPSANGCSRSPRSTPTPAGARRSRPALGSHRREHRRGPARPASLRPTARSASCGQVLIAAASAAASAATAEASKSSARSSEIARGLRGALGAGVAHHHQGGDGGRPPGFAPRWAAPCGVCWLDRDVLAALANQPRRFQAAAAIVSDSGSRPSDPPKRTSTPYAGMLPPADLRSSDLLEGRHQPPRTAAARRPGRAIPRRDTPSQARPASRALHATSGTRTGRVREHAGRDEHAAEPTFRSEGYGRAMVERFRVVPAAYVLLRRGDEVLLQLRRNTGYMDDHWAAAAAGHVEADESVFEAAVREAREELGDRGRRRPISCRCAGCIEPIATADRSTSGSTSSSPAHDGRASHDSSRPTRQPTCVVRPRRACPTRSYPTSCR